MESKCDKSCNVGDYLNYSDCKCRKKLTDKLIDECSENDDPTKRVNKTVENENNYECASCIVYNVLMIVSFKIFTAITIYKKLTKNQTKTLIFLILDMSQRKKLVIVWISIVLILCI